MLVRISTLISDKKALGLSFYYTEIVILVLIKIRICVFMKFFSFYLRINKYPPTLYVFFNFPLKQINTFNERINIQSIYYYLDVEPNFHALFKCCLQLTKITIPPLPNPFPSYWMKELTNK